MPFDAYHDDFDRAARHTIASQRRDYLNKNEKKYMLEATGDFLNTNIANKIKEQINEKYSDKEDLYAATISRVVKETKPISIKDLEKAYTVITEKFIKPEGVTPKQYAKNVIAQAIEEAGRFYDVEKCRNSFAEEYLNLNIKELQV